MIKATIKLVLNGRPMSNGLCMVYLQIIKDRKRKLISLGLTCKKEHFQNEYFTKKHRNYQAENEVLLTFKKRALETLRKIQLNQQDFTLEEFEAEFRGKKQININVINFFDEIIDELKKSKKMGNAEAYERTRNSLIKFKGKKFKFKEATPTFLEKYEVFLRENDNTNGGISFKMRHFRALFNKAIKRKLIPKEWYPFADYKISKLKSNPNKRALSIENFKKIRDFDITEHPHLLESYHYFLFSVYTRGMNFKDMMDLRWDNIKNGRIYYTRSKTKVKINLGIIEPVQGILDYYKAQNRPTDYVFPILLHENLTAQQVYDRRKKVLRRYNLKLKELAKLAGVEEDLTSYVARHSFATILKMSGTPIEKISEMMGHSDVSITIAYLKDFSNEDLDEENEKLINL